MFGDDIKVRDMIFSEDLGVKDRIFSQEFEVIGMMFGEDSGAGIDAVEDIFWFTKNGSLKLLPPPPPKLKSTLNP